MIHKSQHCETYDGNSGYYINPEYKTRIPSREYTQAILSYEENKTFDMLGKIKKRCTTATITSQSDSHSVDTSSSNENTSFDKLSEF